MPIIKIAVKKYFGLKQSHMLNIWKLLKNRSNENRNNEIHIRQGSPVLRQKTFSILEIPLCNVNNQPLLFSVPLEQCYNDCMQNSQSIQSQSTSIPCLNKNNFDFFPKVHIYNSQLLEMKKTLEDDFFCVWKEQTSNRIIIREVIISQNKMKVDILKTQTQIQDRYIQGIHLIAQEDIRGYLRKSLDV